MNCGVYVALSRVRAPTPFTATPGRTDGALVRVSTPVSGGVAETTDVLVRYIQALYPVLADYLPE